MFPTGILSVLLGEERELWRNLLRESAFRSNPSGSRSLSRESEDKDEETTDIRVMDGRDITASTITPPTNEHREEHDLFSENITRMHSGEDEDNVVDSQASVCERSTCQSASSHDHGGESWSGSLSWEIDVALSVNGQIRDVVDVLEELREICK